MSSPDVPPSCTPTNQIAEETLLSSLYLRLGHAGLGLRMHVKRELEYLQGPRKACGDHPWPVCTC